MFVGDTDKFCWRLDLGSVEERSDPLTAPSTVRTDAERSHLPEYEELENSRRPSGYLPKILQVNRGTFRRPNGDQQLKKIYLTFFLLFIIDSL